MEIAKREIRHLLFTEIATQIDEIFGEKPYIRIIQFDRKTGVGILRCGHTSLNHVVQSLQESKRLEEFQLRTLGTSGSIKTLKRKFLSKEFK